VNNGDIWIALGAAQIVRWGEAALQAVTEARATGLDAAEATLKLALERQSAHPW
jgi:hypothetical protein